MRKTTLALTSASLCSLLLVACGGGDGNSEPGISTNVQTTYMTAESTGAPDYATDPAGEDSSFKGLTTAEDVYIQLGSGLVNLKAVELVPCSSLAAKAATRLLNFVFPVAMAHSAIPSGPSGVIDVQKPDLLVWDLGALSSKPGKFCGLKLEISPFSGEEEDGHGHHSGHSRINANAESGGHGDEEAFSMAGKGIVVGPCVYETDADSDHNCFQAAYTGESIQRTLEFDEPLVLNENNRAANVLLVTHYDSWFDGLDISYREDKSYPLLDSEEEQAKLAQNVLNSFDIHTVE